MVRWKDIVLWQKGSVFSWLSGQMESLNIEIVKLSGGINGSGVDIQYSMYV